MNNNGYNYGRNNGLNSERAAQPGIKRKKASRTRHTLMIIRRTLLVIVTVILLLVFALFALCKTVAVGPSETMRDFLVLTAMQSSGAKWVPGLFLEDSVVEEICARSQAVQTDVVPIGDLIKPKPQEGGDTTPAGDETEPGESTVTPPVDEWANAVDGMIYETVNGPTFKAYVLIVADPSRVYVGTSSDYKSGKTGVRIFDIVKREGAVAAINAGEFSDTNGQGTGDTPIGLTYSKGNCVWDDGKKRTFIGFDSDNKLVVTDSMTRDEASALYIRDAVSFQTGNRLISNDGENLTLYYADGNTGTAQRTAIGQRADGAVILVVTDGRTASSLGATRNDIIDLLISYGAVTAGMLDGGSSAMMYYQDYYTKYNLDESVLDEYQLMGLTNRYKAFTKPRRMPTYFLISPQTNG